MAGSELVGLLWTIIREGTGEERIRRVLVFHVLNRAAAFYAADGEPGGIGEAADDSRLPFQRALECFVEFGGLI